MSAFEVDVVIPAHQAEGTVATAVQSALAQSLKPKSVVVVADACMDATARVARESGAEVILAEVGNPGAARNVGLRGGRAMFVAFLDADDRWHRTWLEAVGNTCRSTPASAVFYGGIVECLPTGARIAQTERERPVGRVRDALLASNFITTSAVVVRRDTLSAVGGFDETLHEMEDLDLWLRLAEAYDFTPVRGRHVTYVRMPGSAIRDPAHLQRIREQHLRVIEDAFNRYPASDALRRRALAHVYSASAGRYLAAGAARASLGDAVESFRRWPLDPGVWALAALALQPAPVRRMILAARRRWRQRPSPQASAMGLAE